MSGNLARDRYTGPAGPGKLSKSVRCPTGKGADGPKRAAASAARRPASPRGERTRPIVTCGMNGRSSGGKPASRAASSAHPTRRASPSAPSATPGPVETASIATAASGQPSVTPGASASNAAAPTSPVTGVLTDITSAGLSQVSAFRIRLDDGTELSFRIGVLEDGAEFPPGHLAEHLASSLPVRVFFRVEGAELVVYRIEDAG